MDVLASFLDRGDAAMFVGAGISKRQPARAPIWTEMQAGFIKVLYARLKAMNWPTDVLDDERCLTDHRFRPEVFWDVVQRESSLESVQAAFRVLSVGSPNLNHRTLAHLLGRGRLDAVITTNFDEHVEGAVLARSEPVRLTYASPDPELWHGESGLLKLHGTLSVPESLRFTLAHYDTLAEPLAEALTDTITGRRLLIAGYSGWDEDILPVLAEAVTRSAGTLVVIHPSASDDEPVRSLAQQGADLLEADINELVQVFAAAEGGRAAAALLADAAPPDESETAVYRQAVEALPLVVNSLVIARLHELAGDYARMYRHALLAGDIVEDGLGERPDRYAEAVQACLDAAAAKAGRGEGLGAFYHRALVGRSGHMETFHDWIRKADGIARQTNELAPEQVEWSESYAADLRWREEASGAPLPEPERAHAFWAVARLLVRQGRLDEALDVFRDVGVPEPGVVGHVAATEAYLAAAGTALAAAAACDDEQRRASLRTEAFAWNERADDLARQTMNAGAIAAASANLARLGGGRSGEAAGSPARVPRDRRVKPSRTRRGDGDYHCTVVVPWPTAPRVDGDTIWFPGPVSTPEAVFRLAEQRGYANGSYNLGVLLRRRGDLREAERAFTRAHERAQAIGDAHTMRASRQRIEELGSA
jgi:tetratricopeptide (TPR) repeat protein